jgi:hypothetical protein
MTEEQKRAFEEAVKRAIEDWLKNKSTLFASLKVD